MSSKTNCKGCYEVERTGCMAERKRTRTRRATSKISYGLHDGVGKAARRTADPADLTIRDGNEFVFADGSEISPTECVVGVWNELRTSTRYCRAADPAGLSIARDGEARGDSCRQPARDGPQARRQLGMVYETEVLPPVMNDSEICFDIVHHPLGVLRGWPRAGADDADQARAGRCRSANQCGMSEKGRELKNRDPPCFLLPFSRASAVRRAGQALF